MKSFLSLLTTFLCIALFAQDKPTFGAGYFGETAFHPGIIVQMEYSRSISNKISIPVRVDIGYYMHRRNHQALFSALNSGLRWHVGTRMYTGINGGIGLMSSWHHSDDGVYAVDESGSVSKVSSFAGIDFMPSAGLEFAFQIIEGDDMSHYLVLRPKGFWQMNVNEKGLFHYAVELAYTFTISTKK